MMSADDTARQIIATMKGGWKTDATKAIYISNRLESYAESRVVELREMNRLLKEEIRELRLI